jgi:hypothetical protein
VGPKAHWGGHEGKSTSGVGEEDEHFVIDTRLGFAGSTGILVNDDSFVIVLYSGWV